MSIVGIGLVIGIIALLLVLRRRGARASLMLAAIAPAVAAGLVFYAERDAGGTIDTFDDALWWALATVTTVGYGDVSPVTTVGRSVATLLMLVGVGLFGLLTATVAAYFVSRDDEPDRDKLDEVLAELRRIRERLDEDDGRGEPEA